MKVSFDRKEREREKKIVCVKEREEFGHYVAIQSESKLTLTG